MEAWEAALENTNMVLKDGVNQLLIDITPEGTLFHILLDAEIGLRPTQDELPDDLQGQLRITDTELTWEGLVNTESQMDLLGELFESGDEAFQQAIDALLTTLENSGTSVVFTAEIRPDSNSLSPELADRFLIGNYWIQFTGWMTDTEGQLLATLTKQIN